MLLAWIWRFRPGLWHRDNVLVLDRPARRRRDARAQAHGRPPDPAVLPADRRDRDAPRDPARRVDRDDRHRDRRAHRRRRERQLARVRGLHLPRRHGRDRGRPPRRPAAGLRPGAARGRSSSTPSSSRSFSLLGARDLRGVLELWFASAASAAGSAIAAVGTFAVLGSRVRDPDRLPAARAGEPVAAAAAAPAGRDARARTTTR